MKSAAYFASRLEGAKDILVSYSKRRIATITKSNVFSKVRVFLDLATVAFFIATATLHGVVDDLLVFFVSRWEVDGAGVDGNNGVTVDVASNTDTL